MNSPKIKLQREEDLSRFLQTHQFQVEDLGENVLRVQRADELPVFLKVDSHQIYFEVDLGNVDELASTEFYATLLDLNTQILPVSFGLNRTNPQDVRLVLVESRETGDLCDDEVLAVFDALELAVDRAQEVITKALNS